MSYSIVSILGNYFEFKNVHNFPAFVLYFIKTFVSFSKNGILKA